AQETAHLPVDPLHGADEHPHPLVEREGVHLARAVLQPLEVRGQRLLDCRPVEGTEDGGRLVEIQALGWRIGLGAGQPGHRVLGLDVARREPFGRHGVRDLPRRDLRTHDRAGEYGDLVPALAHAVADAGKAERVLARLPEEGAGHGAEDAAAPRLLAREAAEVAVEKERALVTHEVTPLVTGRRLEMLGRDEIEASEGRGRERHSKWWGL